MALEFPLADVHSLMTASALEKQNEGDDPMEKTIVTRVHGDVRDGLKEICDRHGTSISAFFRTVAKQVVSDYGAKV